MLNFCKKHGISMENIYPEYIAPKQGVSEENKPMQEITTKE